MNEVAIASCPHCGKALPEGSKFCQYCGTRLIAAPVKTVQQEKPPETIQPTKTNKEERAAEPPTRKKKNTTAIAALVLSLLLLAGNIYQYTVIQKLKHPVSETSNTMSAMSAEEEIEIWLEKHGNEYKQYKDFYTNMNMLEVKTGDTSLITVTKAGTFNIGAQPKDSSICIVKWRPDLQTLSGTSTIMRLEVEGVKEGITQINFIRRDTEESVPVLVHVLP